MNEYSARYCFFYILLFCMCLCMYMCKHKYKYKYSLLKTNNEYFRLPLIHSFILFFLRLNYLRIYILLSLCTYIPYIINYSEISIPLDKSTTTLFIYLSPAHAIHAMPCHAMPIISPASTT